MKKFFFYLALAAIALPCITACGDDDEDGAKTNPVNLPLPAYAMNAIEYMLANPMQATTTTTGDSDNAPQLQGINITESGKILLELLMADGSLRYVQEDATINGNTYTMNGNYVKGTVTATGAGARTRATENLLIDISVSFTKLETFVFSSGGSTVVVTVITPITGEEAMDRLARTWKMSGAIFDAKSKAKDVKAFEEFDSRGGLFYLEDVLKEALDQGINLSVDEQQPLRKVIKDVTVTKTNKFIINYTDGSVDVAQWSWADASKTKITIRLKDDKMGNKFICDATQITVAFSDTRCNMKLETNFFDTSNSDWSVVVTLKLTI